MMMTGAVSAASVFNYPKFESWEEARQRDEDRQERMRLPRIENRIEEIHEEIPMAGSVLDPSVVFPIRTIVLNGQTEESDWLSNYINPHIHTDMGVLRIRALVRELNKQLLDKGYVTTQVVIPEQNLVGGTLFLQLRVGRLGRVVCSKGSASIPWRNAFPIREGDVLNLRRLEQGLEQMNRLQSVDVSMRLVPSGEENITDIELFAVKGKQIHGSISTDNSGLSDTGTMQWEAALGAENLFHANDRLSISGNTDGSRDGYVKGTRGGRISYTIPNGWDTYTVRHTRYRWHQSVPSSPYSFISSGKTGWTEFTFNHVMGRTQSKTYGWDISLRRKNSRRFINDVEIPVQSLRTSSVELGGYNRIYNRNGMVYARLSRKIGTGWFGAKADANEADAPKTKYHMWLLDVDARKEFTLGYRPASHTVSFHGQWTAGRKRLYAADMISLGNRYTVRGFDGNYTLMGESGWYLRNELVSRIDKIHSHVYAGIDVGAVYGKSTDVLTGRTIAGMALGIRGSFPSGLFYDVFLSRAVYKPDYFPSKTWVSGFVFGYAF